MSNEYSDVVDLDHDDEPAAAPLSNASWAASTLFNAAAHPADEDSGDADTVEDSSVEDEPAQDSASTLGTDSPAMDFATLSQIMSGLPGANDAPDTDATAEPNRQAGLVWTALQGGVAAVCSIVIVATTVLTWADPPPPPKEQSVPVLAVGGPTIAPEATPAVGDIDVPYWAHDPSCYNGNDSDPNAMRQNTTNAVWNCLRGFGGAGGGIDGHTVTLSLGEERNGEQPYLVTEIDVTAGWIPKVPGGEDEWDEHRVPTRLRYVFNDSPDPSRQTKWNVDTKNRRGVTPYRGEKPVLATQVTVVVLETSRPPQQDVPDVGSSTSTPNFPGLPGSRGPRSTVGDDEITPADATFAVSWLQVKGHLPG